MNDLAFSRDSDTKSPRQSLLALRSTWLIGSAAGLFAIGQNYWQWADRYPVLTLALLLPFFLGQVARLHGFLLIYAFQLGWLWMGIPATKEIIGLGTFAAGSLLVGYCAVCSAPALLLGKTNAGWRAVAMFAAYILPPIGLIAGNPPALVAGILYPGLGIIGIGLTASLIWGIAEYGRAISRLILLGATTIALGCNYAWITNPPKAPDNWVGLNTEFGNFGIDVEKRMNIANVELPKMVRSGLAGNTAHPSVIFLPEGTVMDGDNITDFFWKRALQGTGTTVIAGEYRPGKDSMISGVRVLGQDQAWASSVGAQSAATTFPGGMWHPWNRKDHFAIGTLRSPVLVGAHRLHMSWCFESTSLYPHLLASLPWKGNLVFVSIENRWSSAGTGMENVQNVSAMLNARLLGASIIRSINH